jgi:transmembrane sensor
VAYTPSLRRVALRSGRILVDTAPDPLDRPFVVDTDLGRLRALGTRFDVHGQDDAIALAVYEGRVEIRTAYATTAIVPAGQQAHFTARRIVPPRQADATAQAWSRGLLVAHDMPLSAVVAELQRYRRGQLVLAPELAHVLVYGSFPLDDTDKALNMLARTLHLRVRRPLPWRTVIEPA